MKAVDLGNMVLAEIGRISRAISCGEAWKIWMQVECVVQLRSNGIQVAREVRYPFPCDGQCLDLLAQDEAGQYAIELEVESINTAGTELLEVAKQNMIRILDYPLTEAGARFVVVIGYSRIALDALSSFAATPANNAVFDMTNGIGVMVATR